MHRIAGIDGKVDDHLFKLLRICADSAQIAVMVNLELDLLAQQPLQQLRNFRHDIRQLQDFRAKRLLARKGQQLTRERCGAIGIGADLLDIVIIAVTRRMAQQHQVAIADDGSQHIVEIMRHAAGKLPHRLHLGRLRHLPLEPRLLRRVDQAQQHCRFAQTAHPGKAKRNRFVRHPPQAHRHVPRTRRALRKAAHRVDQRSLVFADHQIGRIGRQRLAFNACCALECRIGKQEPPVTIRQRQTQRQLRQQRLKLRS